MNIANLISKAGPRPALRNAIVGGMILGFIEIVQVIMVKWQKKSDLEKYNQMIKDEVSKEKIRKKKEMDKVREGKFILLIGILYNIEIERKKGSSAQPKLVQF